MKASHLLLALFLLLMPLMAEAKSLSHPLKVIATFSILGDFAKQIGGTQVQVYSLVNSDATTNDYKPSPGDLISVERSDLVISNGLGLEGWLADLLQRSKESVRVMQATKNVPARYGAGGGIDPHAWMDVSNAIIYVQNIRDELIAVDPLNMQYYKDNAEAYLFQLKKLDHWIKLQLGRLPAERRGFVLTHDSFSYFSAAYGMNGVAIEGNELTPIGSASDYPDVMAKIKKNGITQFFSENVGGTRLIDEMRALTGGVYAGKLYAAALSEDEGAGTYTDMIRTDVNAIFGALNPPKDSRKSK